MKNITKIIVLILLLSTLITSLAACNASENPSSSDDTTSDIAEADVDKEAMLVPINQCIDLYISEVEGDYPEWPEDLPMTANITSTGQFRVDFDDQSGWYLAKIIIDEDNNTGLLVILEEDPQNLGEYLLRGNGFF